MHRWVLSVMLLLVVLSISATVQEPISEQEALLILNEYTEGNFSFMSTSPPFTISETRPNREFFFDNPLSHLRSLSINASTPSSPVRLFFTRYGTPEPKQLPHQAEHAFGILPNGSFSMHSANIFLTFSNAWLDERQASAQNIQLYHYTAGEWTPVRSVSVQEFDSLSSINATVDNLGIFIIGLQDPRSSPSNESTSQPDNQLQEVTQENYVWLFLGVGVIFSLIVLLVVVRKRIKETKLPIRLADDLEERFSQLLDYSWECVDKGDVQTALMSYKKAHELYVELAKKKDHAWCVHAHEKLSVLYEEVLA